MKPSIMNVRIDVSLEHEEKIKGRLGCSEIPYTSEQWSLIVHKLLPFLISHILIEASQEPDNKPNGISGMKDKARTF